MLVAIAHSSLLLRRLMLSVVPQVSGKPLDSGSSPSWALAEWSPCRVVQPREQILYRHSSLQSPWQQTLATHDDTVLATEKLPPSRAPALHTGPSAKEWPVFVLD